MTKQHEMDLYDEFTAKLGHDSYLGPWLAGMRESVFADIRNDFAPAPLAPSVAYTRAARIVEVAKAEAERLLAHAQTNASARAQAANDQVAAVLARGRRWLSEAAAQL